MFEGNNKMPLSEQEQRLLEEMERSLYSNDSDFVATVGGRGRPNYTMVVVGVLAALVGIAVIVTGVILRTPPLGPLVGVLGFVILVAGALFAIAPPRRKGTPVAAPTTSSRPSTSRAPRGGGSMMDRFSERWDRRQDGDRR